MTALTLANIKKICTDFVNDPDTTIGMECGWEDYLMQEQALIFSKEQILKAFNVTNTENIVAMEVCHKQYGNMDVYIAIYDNVIVMSTKAYLL